MKATGASQTPFAVEAVAASQVREFAQQVSGWQGRVFVPVLHGVGVGRILDEPPRASRKPAILVMQLVDGTLKDQMFEGEALIMVAWALASTLSLLNEAGFIHGDLKPASVLWKECSSAQAESTAYSPGGWPLLTDFGSAHSFSSMCPQQQPLSVADQIHTHAWTRAYAAPEVLSCGGSWQTIRSDVYSWALTMRAVSRHCTLPLGLQELCEACESVNPESRPSSFADIAAALEKLCPACLPWGRSLWEQQQGHMASAEHPQQRTTHICKQGLQVLVSLRQHLSVDPKAEAESLGIIANQLLRVGSTSKALSLYEELMRVNPDRAVSCVHLDNLGTAYGDLGDHAKMRDLLERATKIKEAYFGKDHFEVAITLGNLGTAYGALGDHARERDLLERALKILEAHFGKDHFEVATILNNLGNAYGDLGDHTKKKDLLERALKIKEAHFGKDHFEVATLLSYLGTAYGDLGNHAKMRDLLETSLKIKETYFGKDHFEVALILNNVGIACGALGDHAKERDLLERALRILEAHFGKDHFEMARTLGNLGTAYGALGDHAKMRDLLERALKIKEAYSGKDHFEVAMTLGNLGTAYGALGDHARERDLLQRALKILEAHFGKDHFEVAMMLNNLGNAYGDLGDHAQKKDLLERALKIKEAHFGKDHFEVAISLYNLANGPVHVLEGSQVAKTTCERALRILRSSLGPTHPHTLKVQRHLHDVLLKYEACLRHSKVHVKLQNPPVYRPRGIKNLVAH